MSWEFPSWFKFRVLSRFGYVLYKLISSWVAESSSLPLDYSLDRWVYNLSSHMHYGKDNTSTTYAYVLHTLRPNSPGPLTDQ